ncbi:hypothetical protein [Haloimpatiens massiliensis]|uniref:hypothetical protein n=1 Tax=Haloimpatiens massiliensis TaxID=1658110 RepID=UPI000C83DCBD|nr:hypothetical protein [Haloimpatiens massiliensis]
MSKIEPIERELISKYILHQLKDRELSTKKRLELNMFKDIYVNNKFKSEVMEKYDVSRSTFYRMEKKFLEAYSKREYYINVKSRKNKLTDEENTKLKEVLKNTPLSAGMPYLRWSIERVDTYIQSNFGVKYSNTRCYQIYNKNVSHIDDNEIIEFVNTNYKNWYNIDIFYLNKKSNEETIKRLEKETRLSLVQKRNRYVYCALAVDANSKDYGTTVSLKNFSMDNSMKYKLIGSLIEKLPAHDKILLILMNESLNLGELMELKEKHENINFLIIDDKDEVNRIFKNDFEEIRSNMEKQSDHKKVGIHSNHNKMMERKLKNS